MSDDSAGETPAPRVLAEVGGSPDEMSFALYLYGDETFDPDAVSAEMGCAATRAHRKGFVYPSGRLAPHGVWILKARAKPPDPGVLVREVLGRLPTDALFWARVRDRYRPRLGFGVLTGGWNRGFDLDAAAVAAIAATGLACAFDLYMDGPDDSGTDFS